MKINIDLKDEAAQATLQRLIKAGQDFTPLMNNIAEHLLNTTRQRFIDETDPQGEKWKPLKSATKARKKKHKDKVLTEDGYLRGSIVPRTGKNHIEIGSTREYAGTHQFGAKKGAYGKTAKGASIPWGKIPPRPYLGLSTEDQDHITKLLTAHIRRHT